MLVAKCLLRSIQIKIAFRLQGIVDAKKITIIFYQSNLTDLLITSLQIRELKVQHVLFLS